MGRSQPNSYTMNEDTPSILLYYQHATFHCQKDRKISHSSIRVYFDLRWKEDLYETQKYTLLSNNLGFRNVNVSRVRLSCGGFDVSHHEV